MGRPRLCIVTLDPDNRGGILSMMRFAYRHAERLGFDPYLAYTSVGPHHQTILRLLRGERVRHFEWREAQGLGGYSLGANFIEIEFLVSTANLRRWRRALAGADAYLAVGGMNQCAVPLALLRKPFVLWVATTLREERAAKAADLRRRPWHWRAEAALSRPLLLGLERLAFRRAARVLALSAYTARNIVVQHGIPPGKVVVAPFPLDTTTFTPRPGPPPRTPTLLFVGRPHDGRKNVGMLLDAFHRVRRAHPDARLTIVGGRLTPAQARRVDELGLGEHVRVHEDVPNAETVRFFHDATLFVLPSLQEGLGIVVLEAMACGLPVVATRCGGPEDLVVDGETGLLVRNDDAEAFAGAVIRLLGDLVLCAEMGQNAVKRVHERYVYEEIAARFAEAYREVFPALLRG